MHGPEASEMTRSGKSSRRIAWLLAGLILLSFAFGVAMFLPAEHRAQKLEQMQQKYQAKQHRMPSSSADPPARATRP
jgi:hypothetical protein